jgi:hypothetical protein
MDLLGYIALFRRLLRITETISKNPLTEKSLIPVIDSIVCDIIELLNIWKREQYNLSLDDLWRFQHQILAHRKHLEELIEKLGLFRICSKCSNKYLATSKYFYPDKSTRIGLRSECKVCYSEAKKEYYKNKVKNVG